MPSKEWWKEKKQMSETQVTKQDTMYQTLRGFDKFVWAIAIFNACATVVYFGVMLVAVLLGLNP